jgi:hypothetical protein
MAQITIDIADVNLADVRDSLAIHWNYPVTVPDPASTPELPLPNIANPQSKTAFLKAYVANWIKANYMGAKAVQAGQAAEAAARVTASAADIS